jgi:hypothetical protein
MLLTPGGPAAGAGATVPPNAATLATVTPPTGPSFALRAVFPNPSRGDPSVRLSVADDSPATLDVFDVLGRRISAREVGGAAGERTLALSPGRALAPGDLPGPAQAARERRHVAGHRHALKVSR